MHVDSVVLDGVGDTKIDQLESALNQEEVGGLQIGMNDIVFVDCPNALEHFLPIVTREVNIQDSVLGIQTIRKNLFQVRFTNFHENTEGVFVRVKLPVIETDNSIQILQFLKQINFSFVASQSQRVDIFQVDSLESKDLKILSHNSVDSRASTTADTVQSREWLVID